MFKYRENQAKLIAERPFIFSESKSDIAKDNYIEWAATKLKRKDEEVHVFDVPHTYKFDFLDKFRKKLLTTGYAPSQNGGSHMFSVFQLSENKHAICTYHFDVEDLNKDFISVVLIANKSTSLLDFIDDNKDIEENFESTKRVGFN